MERETSQKVTVINRSYHDVIIAHMIHSSLHLVTIIELIVFCSMYWKLTANGHLMQKRR